MTVEQYLSEVNSVFRGTDDDAPTFGDEDAVEWLLVLNRKKNEFYRDTKQKWSEAFAINSAGTIAAGDQDYNLSTSFLTPSDQVYVIDTNGKTHYFDFVKPQQRGPYTQAVYISGVKPKVLNFTKTISATDPIVGGTLYVPGYYIPSDLTASSDTLPFPDPYWAVYSSAAELAFNDVVYETKAADLTEKANSLYRQMVVANRALTYNNARTVPYNVKRITSPTR